MAIHLFEENISLKLNNKRLLKNWVKGTIETEGKKLGELNYIFCNDEYLLKMNIDYLQHDTLTDIITFDQSEEENIIEGDIFISVERVKENAEKFSISFQDELCRVMVHGVLHLIGYKDKSTTDKTLMRKMEDLYLSKREI